MAHSSLVTLTEVSSASRSATLAEQGWGYWCATDAGVRGDDSAVCWRKDTWTQTQHWVKKLHGRFPGLNGRWLADLWATTALLRHKHGPRLLVSVAHMPAHVEGYNGAHWRGATGPRADELWRVRKAAYIDTMDAWATHVKVLVAQKKPDSVLVVADWNIDLKDDWFRDFMNQRWGSLGLKLGWKHFPTAGGSMGGNRIIDGSFYSGMGTEDGASLLPRTSSSDHRPYTESFTLTGGATTSPVPATGYDPVTGSTRRGVEWWGFGDYRYDELYEKVHHLADGSTQVNFDFNDENVPYY